MGFASRLKENIRMERWEYSPVTLSFGVATMSGEMERAEQLVEAADRGMYAAKRAGKDCILVGV